MEKELIGDYCLEKRVCEDAIGSVYIAEHRWTKKKFFLKLVDSSISNTPQFSPLFEEHLLPLLHLQHPHIVQLHTVSQEKERFFWVMDFLENEDGTEALQLLDYLHKRNQPLGEQEILRMAYQVASALDFAHEKYPSLIHGSLKLSSFWVKTTKKGLSLCIADFGLSHVAAPEQLLVKTCDFFAQCWKEKKAIPTYSHIAFLHHFFFLAPEQKQMGEKKSQAVDTYAFGVFLYFLLTQKFPEGVMIPVGEIRTDITMEWDVVLKLCLQANPEKRPLHLKTMLDQFLVKNLLKEQVLPPLPSKASPPAEEGDLFSALQEELKPKKYKAYVEENKQIAPLLTEMLIIPAGHFMRGSQSGGRDEMPRHTIYLPSFAIDIHPVTNEQFARFLEFMGGEKDPENHDIIRLRESRLKRAGGKIVIESGYSLHPVVGVSWYGASAYAQWIGKRLPTEAEWEIAALGTFKEGVKAALYPTGNSIDRSQANFFSSDTTPVMSYPPTAVGLYDMAGNVYEWCSDWYDYHYYEHAVQEPTNPQGPSQGVYRVLRGGCWKSLREDLRCSHRNRNNPGITNTTYGFRCAVSVK